MALPQGFAPRPSSSNAGCAKITPEENVDDKNDKDSGHPVCERPQRVISYATEPTALTGY